MSRLIAVRARGPFVPGGVGKGDSVGQGESDDVPTQVAKLVPGEIVAGYIPLVAAAEAIGDKPGVQFALAFIVFCVGVVATPLYMSLIGKPRSAVHWLQIGIATVAFVLWAYLLGGPFAMPTMNNYLPWEYDKRIASVIVGLYTWVVGLGFAKLVAPQNSTGGPPS